MKRIIASRGLGKTTKLIELAYVENAILVCHNNRQKSTIEEMAHLMNKPIIVLTIQEVIRNSKNYAFSPNTKILIDELDLCMGALLPGILDGYSLTIRDDYV